MTSTLPFQVDPVVDELLRSPNDDRLRLLPGDRNWVIRFIHPRQYAAIHDLLPRTRAAHDELERFGIRPLPRAYLEVEERPGSGRTMVVIAARVTGEDLASAAAQSEEAAQAAGAVVTNTLRYYAQKYLDHTPYFSDVHIGQFMWGTHLHSHTPGAWLVDLDAGGGPLARDPDARQIALLHWWIGETASSAVQVELSTGKPAREYRRLLDELEHTPVFAHPSAAGRVDRMREALDAGETFDANEEWVQPLLG